MLSSLSRATAPHSSHSPASPVTGARRRLTGARSARLALVAVVAAALGACSPTIDVPAGSDAGNPLCAKAVLITPVEVGGLSKVKASSQATAAWGEPGAAITLRCGVDQPAIGVGNCQEIVVPIGGVDTSFDWITDSDENGWTFTTYGRDPAITVQVPAAVEGQPTAALVDLAVAVNEIPVTKRCV